MHVWQLVRIGGLGRGTSPVNMLLNGTIPAFVNNKVASSGTSADEAITSCPLLLKNSKYSFLISIDSILFKKMARLYHKFTKFIKFKINFISKFIIFRLLNLSIN